MLLLSGCTGIFSTDNGEDRTTSTPIDTVTPGETTHHTTALDSTSTATSVPTDTQKLTINPTQTDTPSQTPTDTPSQTPTTTPPPDDSGEKATFTVAIEDTRGGTRQLTPEIQQTLDYWERNSERYAGYPTEFTLDPDAENPDILISYVSRINSCPNSDDIEQVAGCTKPGDGDTILIQIEPKYTDKSLVNLFKHEFGHALGLGHGDEPKEVMAAIVDLTLIPKPDLTERDLPWNHSTLAVSADLSNVPSGERAAIKRQINRAIEYYDTGADGTVPERASFRWVDDPENADITIRFSGSSPCPAVDERGTGSCHTSYVYNLDSDSAPEIFGSFEIVLTNLDTEVVGWNVAYNLGGAFGFTEPSDWPEQLHPRAPAEVRRSDWWN